MAQQKIFELMPVYVEYMPEVKEQGILYISKRFELAIHLCACGCGMQTVTPFRNPAEDWTLTETNGLVTRAGESLPCSLLHYR